MILATVGTFAVLLGLWVISGYIPTMNIETPSYTVIETTADYEVRCYDAYVVAETLQSGSAEAALSSGFKELFQYISGNNTDQRRVRMTAPVIQSGDAGGRKIPMSAPVIKQGDGKASTIAFVMPPGSKLEDLPVPGNPHVMLRVVAPQAVAVVTFSGYATGDRIREQTDRLLAALQRDGRQMYSAPRIALYNPPWTPPFMRRNEVMVEVEQGNGKDR